MSLQSTDTLEHILENICLNDTCADAIREVLNHTLAVFQWHYQTATDTQTYDNAINGANLAVTKTVELLRNKGENSLADEIKEALFEYIGSSILTKSKVLSQAKAYMKEALLTRGMSTSKYNKNYAKYMEITFIELCNKYPLTEAPSHYDSNFEPPVH